MILNPLSMNHQHCPIDSFQDFSHTLAVTKVKSGKILLIFNSNQELEILHIFLIIALAAQVLISNQIVY